jgi:hypothetical protein
MTDISMTQVQTQYPIDSTSHRTSHRISTPRSAIVGTICVFKCKGKLEYGRIVNVTATSIRIERMQKTANGEFILHPNQKNTTTKNVITFSRKIETVAVPTTASAASATTTTITITSEPFVLHGGIKRRYPNAQSVL